MKIALAQQNYHIGNFEINVGKIISGIQQAKEAGADLVVFTELCVCGYPPQDFLEFDDFIHACETAVNRIAAHTQGIGVLIGTPCRNENADGKDLYNAAFLLEDGAVKGVVHKTLLPNYDIFDEYRYFEPADHWRVLEFRGKKLAVTICEDIWNMGENPLYRITPMDELIKDQPDLMINLSASPYNYAQDVVRNSIVKAHTLKYGLPMLYCNTVGSQTEVVFDGGSLVYDNAGNKVKECRYFEEDFYVVELDALFAGSAHTVAETPIYFSASEVGLGKHTLDYLSDEKNIEEIYQALVLGIKDYFTKMGFTKAILGASGGIDSALVQVLAVDALGKENVWAILMPSQYSTGHSVADAEQLSRNLGNPYNVLPIKNIYDAFLKELAPVFKDLPFSVAEENIQSRSRGNLLMALSNKFGNILLNTSNKSELATGYGTLYGDMAGGIGVLGDVYKTQVYALARYINRNGTIIPDNIIIKPPSAELRPGQKDSDSLPDYADLDTILVEYIEGRKGPREIEAMGYDAELVDRILKMVNRNEYKRKQFCPIIRVSYKAFGPGRRMPVVGKYLS
ncbi:NAD+ synthase [Niabella drilacis]|uniref:Glutamine-dependent NAD(+) synthetase n=1 Tax=Niabella drilacis (strain DSM 25811 / CCM 8410 / CCUG 62505 / LMG 26954 / E90) TaxID=1285928 RepID=A0A1G6J6J6_NIADE|nr:NAD+ synthase [Niabella drilacis]SDC14311.1 NAD+ synthase (glutamine-hydrolysing) [Niabella drilacis]